MLEFEELRKVLNLNPKIVKSEKGIKWSYVSRYNNLSEEIIEQFSDKVDWDYISKYQVLSEDFIRKFKHKVSWREISYNQKLSERFLGEFKDSLSLYGIIESQELSTELIEWLISHNNSNFYFPWVDLSRHQKLSEEFIIKYKDKVDWYAISRHQKLSWLFIKEFMLKLDLKHLHKKIKHKEHKREIGAYLKLQQIKEET